MEETPIVITQDTTPVVPKKKSMSAGLIALMFFVLFCVVLVMYIGVENQDDQVPTIEKTVVYKGNLSATTREEKLSEGFPQNIPVFLDGVKDSTRVEYVENSSVLHSVTYVTEELKEDLIQKYKNFLVQGGYDTSGASSSTDQNEYMSGRKDNDEVSIVITAIEGGKQEVSVAFLDRQ